MVMISERDDLEFARHCASLRRLKQARGWLTDAEWDDLDSEKQIASLRRLNEKRRAQQEQDKVDIDLAERAVARWLQQHDEF